MRCYRGIAIEAMRHDDPTKAKQRGNGRSRKLFLSARYRQRLKEAETLCDETSEVQFRRYCSYTGSFEKEQRHVVGWHIGSLVDQCS